MFIDINSCFASVEQQANPLLRGKCVVVAAYTSPGGCVLAASIEAKQKGIKTGFRVRDARLLCPKVIVLPTDPEKYRRVHLSLKNILADYTDKLTPKSIDEFALDFKEQNLSKEKMVKIAGEIKQRIKSEVGEWIRVSVGIGPNRFLAKTASNLKKPDGLEIIDANNLEKVYERLELVDLYGINRANKLRLNGVGIMTVSDFFKAELIQLRAVFKSVLAYDWFIRLRGWEIDGVEFERKSFGQSYALAKPFFKKDDLKPILRKLVEKMGERMRRSKFEAGGVSLAICYRDGSFWHSSKKLTENIYENGAIYQKIIWLLTQNYQEKLVSKLMVSCFNLRLRQHVQLALFESVLETEKLAKAVDTINHWWGEWTISSAMINREKQVVADRISFGGVRELVD